jgi:hypothetical protein
MAWRGITEADQVLMLSILGTKPAQCWVLGGVFTGVATGFAQLSKLPFGL